MKKILFIGNSLTGHIFDTFKWVVDHFADEPILVDQVWGGGITLEGLLANGRAQEALNKDQWDVVVLQEQSQLPAIPGQGEASFQKSVTQLVEIIQAQGAEPILYETWGHFGGDRERKDLYPDYDLMQLALTKAYNKAATNNLIRTIPIGQIWKKLKDDGSELFNKLVEDDLYHPSPLGQFFNACIFFHLLLKQNVFNVETQEGLAPEDCQTLIQITSKL